MIKINVNPNTGNVNVRYDSGNTVEHDSQGAIFKSVVKPIPGNETNTHTHYRNCLSVFISSEERAAFCENLKIGIETGEWADDVKYALIRYGKSECLRYFPIPLLFENNDTIRNKSMAARRPPHADGWYRHKRNLILKLIGFPLIP